MSSARPAGWLFVALLTLSQGMDGQRERVTITDRKTAADGVTRGWVATYPWPDRRETSQRWRTIAARLVVARHGRVVRRIEGEPTIRRWTFWDGGRMVAVETGPLHGPTSCSLVDLRSGKKVEEITEDCGAGESEPKWVAALMAQ